MNHCFEWKHKQASGHNISIDWPMSNLVLRVLCLKTPTTCIVDSLTVNSQPTAELMSKRSLSNTGIFSTRHITAFRCLRTLNSTSALHLWPILNSKITNRKHKKCEKYNTTQTLKRTLVYNMKAETKGKVWSYSISAGNIYFWWLKFFKTLHMSTNYHESAMSTDFEVTNTF